MAIKLSILVPAYNRPEHLDALLLSIVSQNNEEIEIIVSDDCSPRKNDVKSVLDKHKSSQANLITYSQETNLGEVGNKNFLYKRASGKFLLYIGDDDLFKEGAIKDLLGLIDKYKTNDIFILGYRQEDDFAKSGKNFNFAFPFSISGKNLLKFGAANFDWFPFHFGHPASYIFKNCDEQEDIFQHNVGFAEDLAHLSLLLLRNYDFYFTDRCFMKWRKDDSRDQTNQSNDSSEHIKSRASLLNYIKHISKDSPYKDINITYRRFLFCKLRDKRNSLFIRFINILGVLVNYSQLILFALSSYIREKYLKKDSSLSI